ncbi:MAG: DinB family protein [Thermoanaerobaculaceae bacterium]
MTPEFAAGLREAYCSGFEFEVPVTRNVIAAILESGKEYRPDPKSRTAFELAHHIVTSEIQMLDEIADGVFSMEEKVKERPATVAGLLELYDRELPRALGRVKALPPADLAKVVDFYGAFQLPNVAYISFVSMHTVHHRGQLSAYLRPMGSKVPSIYGGSADEPWQPGA